MERTGVTVVPEGQCADCLPTVLRYIEESVDPLARHLRHLAHRLRVQCYQLLRHAPPHLPFQLVWWEELHARWRPLRWSRPRLQPPRHAPDTPSWRFRWRTPEILTTTARISYYPSFPITMRVLMTTILRALMVMVDEGLLNCHLGNHCKH